MCRISAVRHGYDPRTEEDVELKLVGMLLFMRCLLIFWGWRGDPICGEDVNHS
jgi:hypothetical protein